MNPTYELHADVAVVSLDDGAANTMGTNSLTELRACLERAEPDDVAALVLRGRRGVFSSGFDGSTLAARTGDEFTDLADTYSATLLDLLTSRVPTIALLTGHALGAGALLALACDRRIGVRGAHRIELHGATIAFPVPTWMTAIARWSIPSPRVFELMQPATPLAFDEAARLGTLHALVDGGKPLDRATAAAVDEMRRLGGQTFTATRSMLWSSEAAPQESRAVLASVA